MTDITRLLALDALAARFGSGLNPALRVLLEARALLPGVLPFPGHSHSAGPAVQALPDSLPANVTRLPASAPQAREVRR